MTPIQRYEEAAKQAINTAGLKLKQFYPDKAARDDPQEPPIEELVLVVSRNGKFIERRHPIMEIHDSPDPEAIAVADVASMAEELA